MSFLISLVFKVKCLESVNQKYIINIFSFQLHVDIHIKYILNHFQILNIIINEST